MENRFAAARRGCLRSTWTGSAQGMLLTGTLEPHLAEIGEFGAGLISQFQPQNMGEMSIGLVYY